MRVAIIKWLLRRLGYPTSRLVEGAPSILAVVHDGRVVYASAQNPHVVRAKCRELQANTVTLVPGTEPKVVLYRAVRSE